MKIGVLGGGQLGRMLALESKQLGFSFAFLDPNPQACAAELGTLHVSEWHETPALEAFLNDIDVVTYEFENVPLALAQRINHACPLYPSLDALYYSQHRLKEKKLFTTLSIPTTDFQAINSRNSAKQLPQNFAFPFIIKTATMGYDGKGQYIIDSEATLNTVVDKLFATTTSDSPIDEAPYIAEAFVNYDFEVSQIAVRDQKGRCLFYPISVNHHQDGILKLSIAPTPSSLLSKEQQKNIELYTQSLLEKLDYVGTIAIEFFVQGDKVIANEFAPRVHNSGHWTQDGTTTNQFENHMRAITGFPLGTPKMFGVSAMLNVVGESIDKKVALAVPSSHLHWYEKDVRPGRKVGHINTNAKDFALLFEQINALNKALQTPVQLPKALETKFLEAKN